MNRISKAILIPATLAVGLFSGCSSYGPNTQRGAVGGAALGALAGAIIGNNSGSGNAASGALIGAAAGGLAGGTLGNAADRERGSTYDRPQSVYSAEPDVSTQVVMTSPPPPPPPIVREEVIVARSRPDAVWVEGYWDYSPRARGYVWVPGHWEVPPPRYRHYVAPHWVRRGHSHVYVQGYWRG